MSEILHSPSKAVAERVLKLLNESEKMRISLTESEDMVAELHAQALMNYSVHLRETDVRLAAGIVNVGDAHKLKSVVSKAKNHPGTILIVGSVGAKPSLIIARSDDINFPNANFLIKQLCQEFDGHGGGTDKLAQAGGFHENDIPTIVMRGKELILTGT